MANVTRQDILDRYHEDFPFSYGGKKHIHDIINIKDKDLSNVLSYDDVSEWTQGSQMLLQVTQKFPQSHMKDAA